MAVSLLQAHALVSDPHGDRAYADDKFATRADFADLNRRVVDIESGSTPVSGVSSVGPVTVSGANLAVVDAAKGYRFRVDGAALDLEATGADLILSNWSGTAFDGVQRSYDRYSADALNVQHAGRREFVAALYGQVVHTIDPDGNRLGFHGATPVAQQTVTGSRSDGTALASLLTALAALGLIVDESTT